MGNKLLHQVVPALVAMLLVIPSLPARAGLDRPVSEAGPTRVTVMAYIADVDEINSALQNFTANVFLEYRWRDESLAFPGSGRVVKDLTAVWHPQIQISNQQRVWKTFPEVVTVAPNGDVVYRQRVWGDFSQPLILHDFPFDRQDFKVQLVTVGYSPKEVELVPSPEITYGIAGELSLVDWEVVGWKAEVAHYKPIPTRKELACLRVSFTAERRTEYFIVKVIIPLVLIVMMSWVVFWIDPKEAGSQIGVSMTAMLTLIAYRFAVGTSLPKVSYLTRLDGFILSATILVFASLIEVILSSSLARNDRLDTARRLDRWARLIFPSAFALLTLLAFVL